MRGVQNREVMDTLAYYVHGGVLKTWRKKTPRKFQLLKSFLGSRVPWAMLVLYFWIPMQYFCAVFYCMILILITSTHSLSLEGSSQAN